MADIVIIDIYTVSLLITFLFLWMKLSYYAKIKINVTTDQYGENMHMQLQLYPDKTKQNCCIS